MERIRRGLQALKQNRRSGVSMMIAVCAGVLLLGLTSSLLYAASLPVARANRKIGRERCSQLSASFAQVLDKELRRYVTEDPSVPLAATGEECAPETSKRFYNYVNRVLEDDLYGESDPTDPDSGFFYQTLGGGEETADYGELTVRLRKTDLKENFENIVKKQEGPYNSYGTFTYGQSGTGTDKAEKEQFVRYQFTVDVTARLDDNSSHISTEYYRRDSFQPVYYWNVSNIDSVPDWVPPLSTGFQVYWDGSDFYTDKNFSLESRVRPEPHSRTVPIYAEDGVTVVSEETETWTEEVVISYNYYGGDGRMSTTYKRYIPVHEDDGATAREGGGGG